MDKKLVLTSNNYILLYRQSKEKLCTFSLFTLNPDPSAMMLHNILNYRKPEPCPLFNPLLPALHLNKLFKYPFIDRKSTRLNSSYNSISHARFFFNDTATTGIYTLSLHDALPILSEARALSPF